MAHSVSIQKIGFLNHDVVHIQTDKPDGYSFTPGQATEVALDQDGWREKGRPFTFTNLPDDDNLEFVIKIYPDHEGVTNRIQDLKEGDTLLIGDSWGAISYEGPGTFIAGGAGITPFIAIFKDLVRKGDIDGNRLLFANKEKRDIILKESLEAWLGDDFINILSDEETSGIAHGYVDAEFIEAHSDTGQEYFYLCGPPPMMEAVSEAFDSLEIPQERIVTEDFD